MLEFLEILARGSMTEGQTLVSKEFALNTLKLFEAEGCLSENGQEVLLEKVEDRLLDGTFDVELLNQTLRVDCFYSVKSKNFSFDWSQLLNI